MRKTRRMLGAALALGVSVGLATALVPASPANAQAPFGDEASVKYSQDLWSALEGADMVGASAMSDEPYPGQAPHGAILETLETEVTIGGHTGRAIVKRNYGPGGITTDDVSADRAKHLKAVTVMFKREEGYDADNQNWFWAKYKPDGSLDVNPKGMQLAGRVAKGMDAGCIACHSAAGGNDYEFIND